MCVFLSFELVFSSWGCSCESVRGRGGPRVGGSGLAPSGGAPPPSAAPPGLPPGACHTAPYGSTTFHPTLQPARHMGQHGPPVWRVVQPGTRGTGFKQLETGLETSF
jgi:hypothetical protein